MPLSTRSPTTHCHRTKGSQSIRKIARTSLATVSSSTSTTNTSRSSFQRLLTQVVSFPTSRITTNLPSAMFSVLVNTAGNLQASSRTSISWTNCLLRTKSPKSAYLSRTSVMSGSRSTVYRIRSEKTQGQLARTQCSSEHSMTHLPFSTNPASCQEACHHRGHLSGKDPST